MDKLKEFYERLQKIIETYEGKQTNWSQKLSELSRLYSEIHCFRFPSSKNVCFYEHMRRHLDEDIYSEYIRVKKLACGNEVNN